MSNQEYWECAVDEILSQNNIEATPQQIKSLAEDFAEASTACGESCAPVNSVIQEIKIVEIEPISSCCNAEITGKNTGTMNGHYNACSSCGKTVNIN